MSGGPIRLTAAHVRAAKMWAADDRMWNTQDTVERSLMAFACQVLALAGAPSEPSPKLGATDDAYSPRNVSQAEAALLCPYGHGPMRYDIEDGCLHCRCGAVATTHGNIIVGPDQVETKRG